MYVDGVILILTEACNGRCTMCNYWSVPHPASLTADEVIRFYEDHISGTPTFLTLSGGEPLLHPELLEITLALHSRARQLVLSTNGIGLGSHVDYVVRFFDKVIISVDGAASAKHQAVRGVDSLADILRVTREIHARGAGTRVVFKMTVQKENFRQLGDFFELSLQEKVSGVALTVPDVCTDAFHRHAPTPAERQRVLLDADEVAEFQRIVDETLDRRGELIRDGFVLEGNLTRFVEYFRYWAGLREDLPPRECVIPGNRLVVTATGEVKPCFFLEPIGNIRAEHGPFPETGRMGELARAVDPHSHPVCRRCYQFLDWRF